MCRSVISALVTSDLLAYFALHCRLPCPPACFSDALPPLTLALKTPMTRVHVDRGIVARSTSEEGNVDFRCLEQRYSNILQSSKEMRFSWVNSPLITALENGDWILVENVNLCSSSVLDRLNGLLEKDGVLSVSERGMVDGSIPTYKPTPSFRAFFTMSAEYGGISRAMRNRGIEIYVLAEDSWFNNNVDAINVLVRNCGLAESSAIALLKVARPALKAGMMSPTDLIRGAFSTNELLQQNNESPALCAKTMLKNVLIDEADFVIDKINSEPAEEEQPRSRPVSALQCLTNMELISFLRDSRFAEDLMLSADGR
ncbi:unnamed protein product [Soboliphyme baturini]|uniref:AAA_5 domain-containing protein n=1 Tax=Soboliphyme baturini TaxID=241478 RepID=A0A183J1W1_9BILA|nr:unnamed protein product [Soboliphyme baturini]